MIIWTLPLLNFMFYRLIMANITPMYHQIVFLFLNWEVVFLELFESTFLLSHPKRDKMSDVGYGSAQNLGHCPNHKEMIFICISNFLFHRLTGNEVLAYAILPQISDLSRLVATICFILPSQICFACGLLFAFVCFLCAFLWLIYE